MLVRAEISAPACRVAQKLNIEHRAQIALYLITTSFKKNNTCRVLLEMLYYLILQ